MFPVLNHCVCLFVCVTFVFCFAKSMKIRLSKHCTIIFGITYFPNSQIAIDLLHVSMYGTAMESYSMAGGKYSMHAKGGGGGGIVPVVVSKRDGSSICYQPSHATLCPC